MLVLVGLFLASLIPCAAMYIWLRNIKGMQDENFARTCDRAVLRGMLTVFPVFLCSATFALAARLLDIRAAGDLVYSAYHTFFVFAFSEELCKFFMMKKVIKGGEHSWLAITIYMLLVGLGFEVIEAIPYAIGSGPGPMFMRGFTMMHPAFGFIMGYFYGKYRHTGRKAFAAAGFILPWVMHGLYDFCLSEPMMAMEWPGYVALGLAAFSVVLIIVFIRFVIKARKKEEFTSLMSIS